MYQSVGAEYVTGEISSLILQLVFRQFYRLIFAPLQKSSYAVIWSSVFPTTAKDILAIYKYWYYIGDPYTDLLNNLWEP